MMILRSVDIEDEVRKALSPYITTYCRPLPKDYGLPNILVTQVGGSENTRHLDLFDVVLDARADNDADASETLRNAVGILRTVAEEQKTALSFVEVNTSGGWGSDPVRPDVSLYSARVRITAHREEINL